MRPVYVALVVGCVIASPILATVGVSRAFRPVIGLAAIVRAVLLAAFGATTAVLLMPRMVADHYPSAIKSTLTGTPSV